jgi:hypothetical protein
MENGLVNKKVKFITDMKNIYVLKTWLLLMIVALVAGCSKDETAESPFAGSDNCIAAFTLAKDGITLKGAVTPDAIVITAPERFSLSGATATVTLSENAAIEPDPSTITDWDAAQAFTVTSYNGIKNKYNYSVERHLVSRDGDVVLLSQADVEAFAAELDADQLNGAITVGAANGQDTVYSLASLAGRLKIVTGGIIINATYAGEDLSGLSDNVEKIGELTIASKTLTTVSFPKLTTIRLAFYMNQATAVSSLHFPELFTVDKTFQITNPDSLVSLSFPKLEQIIEGLSVQGRYNGTNTIESLEFPALKRIGGDMNITYLRKLARLDFPELTSVGAVNVNYLDSARYFTVPKLETVTGSINIYSCGEIGELTFPALKTLKGNIYLSLSKLDYLFCPLLERVGSISQLPPNPKVKFPLVKIVDGDLTFSIDSNPLTAFPMLDSIGSISIAYGEYPAATLDLRGIKVGELSSNAMGEITLFGDDIFPARITIGNLFPFIIKEGFKSIGSLNMSNTNFTTADFSWLEHVKNEIYLAYQNNVEEMKFPNLKSAGGISIVSNGKLKALSMPKLETITGYTDRWGYTQGGFVYSVSSDIASVELPSLKSVVGDVSITGITAARPLEIIDFSSLESLTGALTLAGTNNAAFKDLSKFCALKSAAGVTIAGFIELNDFEPLKNVIPSLTSKTWAVGNCAYNPTYQNMADGKYKP